MIKALCDFRDLQDGHLYRAGEPFPHDGREIPAERISELSGAQNASKRPLIQVLDELPGDKAKPRRKAAK